ncbi:MAG: ATP-binding cassette domain-containing protein [Burkholderiaceae bacterium]|nr:ATP-binding cassette domain-containing protein [Burkholderiaceae bacterium]
MTTPNTALTLDRVSVHRGSQQIVQSINLDLPVGQMLGVLGPNGAGKTSLS